jgi:tetratricopeptide (TPR) repeat protein
MNSQPVNQLIDTGQTYQRQGDLKQALAQFEQGLTQATAQQDAAQIAACHNLMGEIYQYWGDLKQALTHYEQAAALAESAGTRTEQVTAFNGSGEIYHIWDDLAQARRYYEQAYMIAEAEEDQAGLARSLKNIGQLAYSFTPPLNKQRMTLT